MKKTKITIEVSTTKFLNMTRQIQEDMKKGGYPSKVPLSLSKDYAKEKIEEIVENYLKRYYS